MEQLLEAARKRGRNSTRDSAAVLLAYRHGLRAAELCSLRWAQVDLRHGGQLAYSHFRDRNGWRVLDNLLRTIMISWLTIVDPEDGSHEYKARLAGIDFYIWRAIGPRFGISARRRLPNGTSEQLTHSGDIEWYETLEECKARAERILHDHQVRVH
jgi:integrase